MTPRRICFVGDSQLAALKLGWDLVRSDYPGIECFFFGGPGGTMLNVAVKDDALVATSESAKAMIAQISDGATALKPNEFDVICVVGLKYRLAVCLKLLAGLHTYSNVLVHRSSRLVSRSFLNEAVRDLLEHTLAVEIIGMIKSVSIVPVLFVPDPMPTEDRFIGTAWAKLLTEELRPSTEAMLEVYRSATEQIAKSKGATLVVQPPDTISSPGFTRAEFSRGSVRLRAELDRLHDDGDSKHMNQAFGAKMFIEIIKAVDRN